MLRKLSLNSRPFILSYNKVLKRNPDFPWHRVPPHYKFNEIHSRYCRPYSLFQNNLSFLQKPLDQLNTSDLYFRQKSSKQRRSAEYVSDSDSDNEIENIPGSKILQIQTDSLRCDTVLKMGLGLSRNKLEVLFYENKIRVDGKRVLKKSQDVSVGNEIDVIKGLNEENPNFVDVSRVEILKIRPTGDVLILSIRKSKTLIIENYEEHPWVETETEN